MRFHTKSKQVGTQDDRHAKASSQLPDVATSCPLNATANNQVRFKSIKCVSPMTFSQKLYQSDALDIAEEFEPPINANSLEEIKKLLDNVFEIDESSST